MEKGYRAWGHELDVNTTPLEAGLGFVVDWDKEFTGKAALLQQRAEGGLRHRIATLRTPEEDLPLWGNEPVLRNGQPVGYVTSAGYAHSIGGQVALATISHDDLATKGFISGGEYVIDVGGTHVPATASLRPAFDPKGERVRL